MTCHSRLCTDADLLRPVRESSYEQRPIAWRRVHDLPDFTHFDHSIQVRQGVGCSEGHGPVDDMAVDPAGQPHAHAVLHQLPPRPGAPAPTAHGGVQHELAVGAAARAVIGLNVDALGRVQVTLKTYNRANPVNLQTMLCLESRLRGAGAGAPCSAPAEDGGARTPPEPIA